MIADIVRIAEWRRLALELARLAAAPKDLNALLARKKVPRRLRPYMRAVIGRHRHRRYRDAPGLTGDEPHELATLTTALEAKPVAEWDAADFANDAKAVQLRTRLHGRKAARQIDLSVTRGLSAPGVATLARVEVPAALRGLWRRFDAWGARRHKVSVVTFRRWRRTEQHREASLLNAMQRQPSHPDQAANAP